MKKDDSQVYDELEETSKFYEELLYMSMFAMIPVFLIILFIFANSQFSSEIVPTTVVLQITPTPHKTATPFPTSTPVFQETTQPPESVQHRNLGVADLVVAGLAMAPLIMLFITMFGMVSRIFSPIEF